MPSCWRRSPRQTYTWNQFGGWYLGSRLRVGFTPSISLIPWVQKSRNLGKKSTSCDQRSEKPWLQTTSLMTFFSFFICNCPPQVKATNDHQIRRVMVHFNPLFTMLNEIWHCFITSGNIHASCSDRRSTGSYTHRLSCHDCLRLRAIIIKILQKNWPLLSSDSI